MDAIPITTSYLPAFLSYPIILSLIALIAAYYYVETSRVVRYVKKLPSPFSVPIFGNILLPPVICSLNPNTLLVKALEYHKHFGSVIGLYLGTRTAIFLSDAQDVEVILNSPAHINKPVEYQFFKSWLGDGLLITSGDKWRKHRKAIAPTFHMSILKTFVPLFYENSIDLVRRLRSKIGKEFDCHDYLSAVTVDILTETAMGVKTDKEEKTGYEYASAVMKMCDIVHRRHYNILYRLDALFNFTKWGKAQDNLLNTIHTLTNGVIEKKAKSIERLANEQKKEEQSDMKCSRIDENVENYTVNYTKLHYARDDLDDIDENDVGEKKRLAFLDLMFEMKKNGEQMNDEEIREEVNTIMFEGHDTTAAGSSFALSVLGNHPEIQARVHEELDEIFGDSDRQCTFQDTVAMKYLERVILETLRLFPPVPVIARQLTEDAKIVTGDYILPKGSMVIIPQFTIHRAEKYYSNPDVFDPDNFLPEKMQNRHYYAFIPFSAGPRSCVGRKFAMLKLKVLLSTILRNYRVISNISEEEFRLRADIILKRDEGFKIMLEPRKAASRLNN